jgi:hypothetical protein
MLVCTLTFVSAISEAKRWTCCILFMLRWINNGVLCILLIYLGLMMVLLNRRFILRLLMSFLS